jgi:hypothetical protein
MREEDEPTSTSNKSTSDDTTLPVALRNEEISASDFEELCRLAEAAQAVPDTAKKTRRRIPSSDPATIAE